MRMDGNLQDVIRLVREMTEAEIMARLGHFGDGTDWFSVFIKKKNELQEYLFGTSDFTKLGIQWGILKEENKKKTVSKTIDDMIGEL